MPEDIPEEIEPPTDKNLPTGQASESEGGTGPYKLDFLIALISFLFPFGWSVSGFPPSIILACACWAITLLALLHFFWAWSKNARKSKIMRWSVSFVVPTLIVACAWRPVAEQYRIQHATLETVAPKLEVRVNNYINRITNGSVFAVRKGEGLSFSVFNLGVGPADNAAVDLYAPLDPSEVKYYGWELQAPMIEKSTMRYMTNRTHWRIKDASGGLPAGGEVAWMTNPLFISTNVPKRLFDKATLEGMDFTFPGTNYAFGFVTSLLPLELVVTSDANGFAKWVFFLDIN
jgi:hypothetical protein